MEIRLNATLIMVVVALLLGLSAAFGVYRYLNQTQEQVKKLTEKRAVVVARRQIPAGTKITRKYLTLQKVSVQSVPAEYPSKFTPILGRIAKNTIEKGELFSEAKLVAKGAATGLSVVIPEGKRAITIMVTGISGVAGFIAPGDHVDVLSIYRNDTGDTQTAQTYSKTIFQDILVLAVGDKLYNPSVLADPAAMVTEQITLALDSQDAEKIALASFKSQIHLILRPFGDKTINESTTIALEDIYDYITVANNQNNVAVASPPTTKSYANSVELILGSVRSYYNYWKNKNDKNNENIKTS